MIALRSQMRGSNVFVHPCPFGIPKFLIINGRFQMRKSAAYNVFLPILTFQGLFSLHLFLDL